MSVLKGLFHGMYWDLKERFPSQRDTQRRKLCELSSAVIMCQSANLMEISNLLDRPTECVDARYNYVERFLKNPLVNHGEVMAVYAKDLLQRLSEHQHTLVLMIDQTKVNDRLEVLMISVRVQKRALPLFWCVKETKGSIGFEEQKKLLETVHQWLPEVSSVMLAGDGFYGSAALINWCQKHKWQYRLRLKGTLKVYQAQGEKNLNTLHQEGIKHIERARLVSGAITPIGIIFEKGHKEAWFIAMDKKPTEYRTLDYGMRWGIETMFSDFKSRGFSLTQTQIRLADRLERLLLVLSVAFHWAVSVGLSSKKKEDSKSMRRKAKRVIDPVCHFLNMAYVSSDSVLPLIKNHPLYGFT